MWKSAVFRPTPPSEPSQTWALCGSGGSSEPSRVYVHPSVASVGLRILKEKKHTTSIFFSKTRGNAYMPLKGNLSQGRLPGLNVF